MSASLELVSAISSGNAVEIESAFSAAISEKIANRLDDMRLSVAQNMFGEQTQTQEIVEFTKEEWEALSEEEQAEYEQLDEISSGLAYRAAMKAWDKGASAKDPHASNAYDRQGDRLAIKSSKKAHQEKLKKDGVSAAKIRKITKNKQYHAPDGSEDL